jgi:hypothetical protein
MSFVDRWNEETRRREQEPRHRVPMRQPSEAEPEVLHRRSLRVAAPIATNVEIVSPQSASIRRGTR